MRDAGNGHLILAADLKETLTKVDQFEVDALQKVDDYIARVGLTVPEETIPQLRDGYEHEVITDLDLKGSGISSIIWGNEYAFDFSLVKLPVVDSDGYPIQKRGVTAHPGLYFLGLPWLHSRKSGILFGVGNDAAYLATHIAARALRPESLRCDTSLLRPLFEPAAWSGLWGGLPAPPRWQGA